VAEATKSEQPYSNILPLDFVLSPTVKMILPLIGHISYLCVASGFIMTDMLHLRIALVGGYTGLVTFHMMHSRPLRIPLRWSALFIALNAGAACFLVMDRYGAPLSQEDEELYSQHFSSALTRGQFHQLLSLGIKEDLPDGTVLTEEDSYCEHVYFIQKGMVKVYHHHAFAANILEGGFVNDVAFSRGEHVGAYGTVVTSGKCSLIKWDQTTLRNYLKSKPEMERNMKYCLSAHLVKSLLRQREAAHARQRRQERTGGGGGEDSSTVVSLKKRQTGTIRRSPSESSISWVQNNKSIDAAPTKNIAAVSPQGP
jgi:CRP-like cAMP-binding protein